MSTAAEPPLGAPGRWRSLIIISAALLIVIIDVTVLYIAAPSMAEDLQPSATGLLWIIDIYALVAAPLLVAASTLGDRFGRKRVLLIGLVIFTAASAVAAFAVSPGMLIAARALQGLGGALVMPNTMSIIRALFPNRRERVKAIGIWSAVMAGGAAAGPLLGGFLVEHFWWGAVFLINVPVLAIVLPLAIRGLPEVKHSNPPPWDTIAVVEVTAGILLLAFGIKEGARHGILEPMAAGPMLGAIALLIAFTRRQLRRPRPLLDVRLFRRPVFSVAIGSVLLALLAWVGLELFLAQYLQFVLGLSPLQASLWLLPSLVGMFVVSLYVSPLLHLLGSRISLAGGFALCAISLVPLFALGPERQFLLFAVPFIVLGVAVQVASVAANDALMSSVSSDDAGQVASIEATAYDLGGGMSVAILGSVGTALYTHAFIAPPGLTTSQADDARESATSAFELVKELPAAASDALFVAARDAWMTGFHAVVALSIVAMSIGAIAWLVVFARARGRLELVPAGSSPSAGEDRHGFDEDDENAIVIWAR